MGSVSFSNLNYTTTFQKSYPIGFDSVGSVLSKSKWPDFAHANCENKVPHVSSGEGKNRKLKVDSTFSKTIMC